MSVGLRFFAVSLVLFFQSSLAVAFDLGDQKGDNEVLDFNAIKHVRGDRDLGIHYEPKITFGEVKEQRTLQNTQIRIRKTGGLYFNPVDPRTGIGDVFDIYPTEDGRIYIKDSDHPKADKKSGTRYMELSIDSDKRFIRDLAWFLIRRYPKKEFTKKYLKAYFDFDLDGGPSIKLDGSLYGESKGPEKETHGKEESILGGDRNRLITRDTKMTEEEMKQFLADPLKHFSAFCQKDGDCAIKHLKTNKISINGHAWDLVPTEADLKEKRASSSSAPSTPKGIEYKGQKRASSGDEFKAFIKNLKGKPAGTQVTVSVGGSGCPGCNYLINSTPGTSEFIYYDTTSYGTAVRAFNSALSGTGISISGTPSVIRLTVGKDGKISRN